MKFGEKYFLSLLNHQTKQFKFINFSCLNSKFSASPMSSLCIIPIKKIRRKREGERRKGNKRREKKIKTNFKKIK